MRKLFFPKQRDVERHNALRMITWKINFCGKKHQNKYNQNSLRAARNSYSSRIQCLLPTPAQLHFNYVWSELWEIDTATGVCHWDRKRIFRVKSIVILIIELMFDFKNTDTACFLVLIMEVIVSICRQTASANVDIFGFCS